jgi:hypothetical protein
MRKQPPTVSEEEKLWCASWYKLAIDKIIEKHGFVLTGEEKLDLNCVYFAIMDVYKMDPTISVGAMLHLIDYLDRVLDKKSAKEKSKGPDRVVNVIGGNEAILGSFDTKTDWGRVESRQKGRLPFVCELSSSSIPDIVLACALIGGKADDEKAIRVKHYSGFLADNHHLSGPEHMSEIAALEAMVLNELKYDLHFTRSEKPEDLQSLKNRMSTLMTYLNPEDKKQLENWMTRNLENRDKTVFFKLFSEELSKKLHGATGGKQRMFRPHKDAKTTDDLQVPKKPDSEKKQRAQDDSGMKLPRKK